MGRIIKNITTRPLPRNWTHHLATYLIVKELVIRDRFKKLLHGDEEASGSPKNDGHKQGDAQPQKLTLIDKSLSFWELVESKFYADLHQRLSPKGSSIAGNNGRVFLHQLLQDVGALKTGKLLGKW